MKTTIAYLFGISLSAIYVYMTFISKTIKPGRYKYRIVFGLIALLMGILMDYLRLYDEPFGFFIIISLMPFIYLICYEIFRILYRPFIGRYPYAPYHEKIGNRVGGFGYPMTRTVKGNDYLFALTLLIVPMIVMIILLIQIE